MGFVGTETKNQIYQDIVNYGVGDTGLAEERLISKTSALWIAAYLILYDFDNYYYKVVVNSSADGVSWDDLVFPHTEGVNYGYINMAIGTDDSIHVIVNDANDMNKVYYSVYSSGAWSTIEIISAAGNIDYSTCLVLDINDKPHIAHSMFAGGIRYSNRISGSWSAWETPTGSYKMMQMDISPSNVLHFALYDASNYPWYMSGTAGSWSAPEEVDDTNAINFMDITCNDEIPVIAATGNGYIRMYTKDGTWAEVDIDLSGESSNRVSVDSALGFVYVAWELSPTPGFDNNQWFYSDNSSGSYSAAVNVTNDDTVFWSNSTLWTDGTNFALYSSGSYSDVACWLITQSAPTEDKWGTLKLNYYEYTRNDIEQFGKEEDLIPWVGVTSAQSRPLMAGRGRERREVSGWATKVDYDSLEDDYDALTKKKVEFHDGTQITLAIIETLDGERRKGSTIVWYKAVFLEVTL